MVARKSSVRKHRAPQISHVIPFFQLCTNSQKSQNFNDPTSNVETTGRELRATFLRNHPRPAPNSALRRQVVERDDVGLSEVRKHRAPKGALRHPVEYLHPLARLLRQKAPSAQNLACNFPEHVSTSTRKPQNLNVLTSKLEGLSAELHATFSGNPAR